VVNSANAVIPVILLIHSLWITISARSISMIACGLLSRTVHGRGRFCAFCRTASNIDLLGI